MKMENVLTGIFMSRKLQQTVDERDKKRTVRSQKYQTAKEKKKERRGGGGGAEEEEDEEKHHKNLNSFCAKNVYHEALIIYE